jgi:ketosteroid isomerase-like protein
MNEQPGAAAPAAVVEAFLAAIASADLEAAGALMDPDVVVIEPATLPYGGVYRGAEAFFGTLAPAIFGAMDVAIGDVVVFDGGDTVAARMNLTFTARGTRQALMMPVVEAYDVRAGKITKIEVFPHDAGVLTQFWEANTLSTA